MSPDDDAALLAALRSGDAAAVGAALHNDLQAASLTLAPHLRRTLDLATEAGALGALISGSGPTVAALAGDLRHAHAIAAAWNAAGVADQVHLATGPVHGARIVTHVGPERHP